MRAPDHVHQPVGRVESLHLVHLHPSRLVGVAGGAQRRPTRRRRRSRPGPNDNECAPRHRARRGRARRPASPTRICRPHSSATSRRDGLGRGLAELDAGRPGRLHLPVSGGLPRRTSSTRPPSSTTAPTPTRGTLGILAPVAHAEAGEPGRARVAVASRAPPRARVSSGESPPGPQVEAVLAPRRPRASASATSSNAGPAAERGLQRGQRGQRVARGREQRAQPRLVHAEQDGAVLQERVALPPLGAAHELAAADLDLVDAGAREAERGHRPVAAAARAPARPARRARCSPRSSARADPAVRLEQVGADAEVAGRAPRRCRSARARARRGRSRCRRSAGARARRRAARHASTSTWRSSGWP